MRPVVRVLLPVLVASALGLHGPSAGRVYGVTQDHPERRMSFHNRLLLNRAVLAGLRSIEVLVVARAADTSRVSEQAQVRFDSEAVGALVTRLGGHVRWEDAPVGYLRVSVPTERFIELARGEAVAGYQISSLSKASWYRDGPPLSNALMHRGFEVTPTGVPHPDTSDPTLPMLTVAESRAPGFTLEDDAGVGAWMKAHPTFDGRGVTIALVENALPNFADPTFRSAKTLDGREVAKIAGIVNAINPEDLDETRVHLDTEVSATTSWARIGHRTFILPRPGRYRVGMLVVPGGGNVLQEFAVAEHQETRELWIDSNGDASFGDEAPLADINERFDPRFLELTYPAMMKVSFVMGRGRVPHTVHIYVGRGSHQSMTLSVAAGNLSDESLAYGVAREARVLLVRANAADYRLRGGIEAFIEAARRPDVDLIGSASGISFVTDTDADFAGLLFSRLISIYRKPVVLSAGNHHQQLGTSDAAGTSWTVGGVLGPATFATLHGGRPLPGLIVHPFGAAGPSIDGAIKPDFLAPMERLSSGVPWQRAIAEVPRNAPTRRVPPGYEISCCTSSTAPYASGFVALLISAAKQANVPYSVDGLDRALKLSSTFLPGFQSHEQGHGALDITAAWQAMQTSAAPPRIVASARIVHPLAQYAARGPEGKGIFEFEGWTAGMADTRDIRFRRESGPDRPLTYRVTLMGNDGTFDTAPSVTLPLGETVTLPVSINPRSRGAHSVLISLHDETSNFVVFRTQATIVASERFDLSTGLLRMTGQVGLMRTQPHYFEVPAGTAGISIELDVHRGVVRPTILPAHGLFPGYYLHVHPMNVRFVGKGKHTVLMPNPEPGTWTIQFANTSAGARFGPDDTVPTDDSDAEYSVTVRVLDASMVARSTSSDALNLDIRNAGSTIREPVVEVSSGTLKSHRGGFNPSGHPNLVEIAVPKDAGTLSLELRSDQPGRNAVELLLYDCTTGECFSYDLGFPAAARHKMVVRKPTAGRWVAAVNTAPFPDVTGSFVLDEIITTGVPVSRPSATPRPPAARWTETIAIGAAAPRSPGGGTPILLLELLDAASAKDEVNNPWIMGPNPRKLRDRPVALGTAIYRR